MATPIDVSGVHNHFSLSTLTRIKSFKLLGQVTSRVSSSAGI